MPKQQPNPVAPAEQPSSPNKVIPLRPTYKPSGERADPGTDYPVYIDDPAEYEWEVPLEAMMADDPTQQIVDAKIAAAEARTATKISDVAGEVRTLGATLSGKMDALGEKISADHEFNRGNRWVMVGLAIAIIAVIIAMVAYGGAMFANGMSVRDIVRSTVDEMRAAKLPTP